MHWEWVEEADRALEALGVPEGVLRVTRLLCRGAPVPLPRIDDFPSIGYLRADEIAAALNAFTGDKLLAVKDMEMRASLAELRGWLKSCASRGRDLICFYA